MNNILHFQKGYILAVDRKKKKKWLAIRKNLQPDLI